MHSHDSATPAHLLILDALNRPTAGGGLRHIYAGTVPPDVVARRRAANRVARKSRRTNRRTR